MCDTLEILHQVQNVRFRPRRFLALLGMTLPPCGYCLKASMTAMPALWIPAYAKMTVRDAGNDVPGRPSGLQTRSAMTVRGGISVLFAKGFIYGCGFYLFLDWHCSAGFCSSVVCELFVWCAHHANADVVNEVVDGLFHGHGFVSPS